MNRLGTVLKANAQVIESENTLYLGKIDEKNLIQRIDSIFDDLMVQFYKCMDGGDREDFIAKVFVKSALTFGYGVTVGYSCLFIKEFSVLHVLPSLLSFYIGKFNALGLFVKKGDAHGIHEMCRVSLLPSKSLAKHLPGLKEAVFIFAAFLVHLTKNSSSFAKSVAISYLSGGVVTSIIAYSVNVAGVNQLNERFFKQFGNNATMQKFLSSKV